jgi:D-galactarolactone isomerase
MHIYDGRFPLAANARRTEADAPVSVYRELQRRLGLERAVVVQPTAYGRDNRCTLAAMAELGAGARGVAVVDESVTDAELERLTRAGMRGVRFRMLDTPELPYEILETMAARLDLLLDWTPDEGIRNRILVANPAELYGFASSQ